MADMRHRDGKLKVMHTIIGDFAKTLRQIAELETVESILTGTIAPSKGYREELTFQYFTDNGLKLLARTTTAVQEIFIVASQPDLLLDELIKSGFVESERQDVRHNRPHRRKGDKKRARGSEKLETAPSGLTPSSTPTSAESEDPITLRQVLSAETIKNLQQLRAKAANSTSTEASTDGGSRADKARNSPLSAAGAHSSRHDKKADDDTFAALFEPEEDDMSFEELLRGSKLDPKFFK